MEVIIVTGTPGTGKTTFAKNLAQQMDYAYVDVNRLIIANKLHERYDRSQKTRVVDVKRLMKFLGQHIKKYDEEGKTKGLVIDSHLAHHLPKSLVDKCYVTTCDLPVLKERLQKRKYGKQKIRDNLDAEIFDTCMTEAQEAGHKVEVADTTP